MMPEDTVAQFEAYLAEYMRLGRTSADDTPGRLAVLLGLLERLREVPLLEKEAHLTDSNQQLKSHDHYVKAGLARFGVKAPVSARGRRGIASGSWHPALLEWLSVRSFNSFDELERGALLDAIGRVVAARLGSLYEAKPLVARFNIGTAIAIVADLLDQAQEKNRAKDVAEYLVGAKLELRFGLDSVPRKNVNAPNVDRPADFQVGGTAIEVTVNGPDSRHVEQIQRILADMTFDIWLLVRLRHCAPWRKAVAKSIAESERGRVAITGIETFVGQNVSEMARFEPTDVVQKMAELFAIYNGRWLPENGADALRIVPGDSSRNERRSPMP